jgi:hypothetical protein
VQIHCDIKDFVGHHADHFPLRAASLIVQSAQDIAAGKGVVLPDKFVPNADFSHYFLVVAPQEKASIVAERREARVPKLLGWESQRRAKWKRTAAAEGGKRPSTLGPCFADFTPASHALLTEAHRGVPTEGGGSRPAWKSASW